ncbi:hypothetical protein NC796_10255 [Aliifodinibius sp. S!AR15-10]|uniref:hypothetical protein n=1 Tax=Aliifodinibius sp. S!AR15-10 TaxID=2950437 RepID=UPI0028669AAD|nr:hypothetical protein [Aliifodinibius sp. S!AR15-10]MDR8391523.1 hypothetical protein [Aliifodinibius sp. S!AR15-10]
MIRVTLVLLLVSILSNCTLLNSRKSTPPEGWFEVDVPVGEKDNSYNIQDLHFLNRDVGWIWN